MREGVPAGNMQELIEISRKYGSDPEFVLFGGGNTSWKSDEIMIVKASGTDLAAIDENGFVILDMSKLKKIREAEYPQNREEREAHALEDLMNSRLPGERGRPSVESLLHAIIPSSYVVHTHPAILNGLNCSAGGQRAAEKLFKDKYLWIPLVDPGYILAKTVGDKLDTWMSKHNGQLPEYIFLQNHGLFLWGADPQEIEKKFEYLFKKIKDSCSDFGPVSVDSKESVSEEFLYNIARLAGPNGFSVFTTGSEIRSLLESKEGTHNLCQSLTPDHIVYMGHTPLVYENLPENQLIVSIRKDYKDFTIKWGKEPKSILIKGKGFISIGNSRKTAEIARLLMLDAIRVIRVSRCFGGPHFMTEEKVNFINTWEVEKYRAKLSDEG